MLCEQLGRRAEFIEVNMEFACKKAPEVDKNSYKINGTSFQECEFFFRPPNRTTQQKVVAPRSDCHHCQVGESLRMMSRNALASGAKDAIRRSQEHTVTMTAIDKAVSSEEATVCVDDFKGL